MSPEQTNLTREDEPALPNRRALLSTGLGMAAASLVPLSPSNAHAQQAEQAVGGNSSSAKTYTQAEQEVVTLSKNKWRWMSERKVDTLDDLFHDKAVFVHMGGSLSKKQELDTIRGGGIQYKSAEIQDVSVQIMDATAILLSTIRLLAVVGGNEVTNPFVVTEVYVKQSGKWKLASLSFTRTLR